MPTAFISWNPRVASVGSVKIQQLFLLLAHQTLSKIPAGFSGPRHDCHLVAGSLSYRYRSEVKQPLQREGINELHKVMGNVKGKLRQGGALRPTFLP